MGKLKATGQEMILEFYDMMLYALLQYQDQHLLVQERTQ